MLRTAVNSKMRGLALLNSPAINKGTAFTQEERRRNGLKDLLPPAADTFHRTGAKDAVLPHGHVRSVALHPECFIVAAEATADQIGPVLRAKSMLFPGQANILDTEVTTAARLAEFMFDTGLA